MLSNARLPQKCAPWIGFGLKRICTPVAEAGAHSKDVRQTSAQALNQVLNNLLDNAFNYTYPGGKIIISACAELRAVVISVSDTGVGIPKEKQDRIWNRFYRDEDQQLVMETSGTGLGLAIVKEYVKMHEGDIWLESEVGKGTTFNVRIPIYTEIVSQAQ